MSHGIHHTAISTPDIEQALEFYRDLLGAEVVSDYGWPAGVEVADGLLALSDSSARVAVLRLGNAMIELFEFDSPTPSPGDPNRPVCDHGITHICLDVSDIDAEYVRLRDAGMRFHCEPQDLGALRSTYGRDPDGNVIELQEVTDPSSSVALRIQPA